VAAAGILRSVIRVSASTVADAPLEAAWELYADVAGSVEWVPFAEEILWIDGRAGPGQRYRERTRLLGTSGEQSWEVVEWDPPRRQVQRSTDMRMESRLAIELQPTAGGTRITQSTELRSMLPRPLRWAHEAVFGLVARYGLGQAVAAARARLEHSGRTDAAAGPGG
jgi:hypothetical protein